MATTTAAKVGAFYRVSSTEILASGPALVWFAEGEKNRAGVTARLTKTASSEINSRMLARRRG